MDRHNEENELQDRRVARVCSLLANIYRDSEKQPKPYTEDDFIPKPPPPPQTPEQQAEVLRMMAALAPRR